MNNSLPDHHGFTIAVHRRRQQPVHVAACQRYAGRTFAVQRYNLQQPLACTPPTVIPAPLDQAARDSTHKSLCSAVLGCISSTVSHAAEGGWYPWCRCMGRQAWASWPLEGIHGACCRLCSPRCAGAVNMRVPCVQPATTPAVCGTCHACLLRATRGCLIGTGGPPRRLLKAEQPQSRLRAVEACPPAKWLQACPLSSSFKFACRLAC